MDRRLAKWLDRRRGVVHFKSCPRCTTGDLIESMDVWPREYYLSCIQCGHQTDTLKWLEGIGYVFNTEL